MRYGIVVAFGAILLLIGMRAQREVPHRRSGSPFSAPAI